MLTISIFLFSRLKGKPPFVTCHIRGNTYVSPGTDYLVVPFDAKKLSDINIIDIETLVFMLSDAMCMEKYGHAMMLGDATVMQIYQWQRKQLCQALGGKNVDSSASKTADGSEGNDDNEGGIITLYSSEGEEEDRTEEKEEDLDIAAGGEVQVLFDNPNAWSCYKATSWWLIMHIFPRLYGSMGNVHAERSMQKEGDISLMIVMYFLLYIEAR